MGLEKATLMNTQTREVIPVQFNPEEYALDAGNSFAELLSTDWTHGVEAAVDVALLGRYYERIADHAVSVANRVVFVVTGENPRSVDA